jgi:hypothetical protein
MILAEQSGAWGGVGPRIYYVPGLTAGWVFAPRPRLQLFAGLGVEYLSDLGVVGSNDDCMSPPCPEWTRNHLRVQADLRLGPAWRVVWPYVRLRGGYAHQFVATDDDPQRDDHTLAGGTANLGLGVSFYVVSGLTVGLEIGGGLLAYSGLVDGTLQFGGHLGWSFGRGPKV